MRNDALSAHRLTTTLAASLVVAGAAVACGTGNGAPSGWIDSNPDSGGGDTVPASNPGAGCGGQPTLSAIQDAIFSKSCAFGSCHGGTNPAAGLNLTSGHSCASLVHRASCVFSSRTLVVPGNPEQSYLYHAIAGDDLGTNPDGTCAGLANGTPSRMPLGGQPLCQAQIDQVKAWIAAGAVCDSPGGDAGGAPGDAGAAGDAGKASDAGPMGDAGSGDAAQAVDASDGEAASPSADVAQITSTKGAFEAGQTVAGDVVLAQPAPASGVSVTLTATDPTVIAVPSVVFVPSGQTSAAFQIAGLRPGHASIQATAGGKGASVDELVQGLGIAEVFYLGPVTSGGTQWVRLYNSTTTSIDLSSYSLGAGANSYAETTVQLSGTIAPGGCFVVGGPTTNVDNGDPIFSQVADFNPAMPAAGNGGAGVALFGVPASSLATSTLPVDAVVYGSANPGNLVAPDGAVAPAVLGGDVIPGDSLMLLGGSWIDQYPPAPNTCGQ
jgi:hypothetical protein